MLGKYDIPEPSLQSPEPETVCRCAYCGDEVYVGNHVYRKDGAVVHVECVLQHAADTMEESEIAALCGYQEGIAGT